MPVISVRIFMMWLPKNTLWVTVRCTTLYQMSILSHIQSTPNHAHQYELLIEYGTKLIPLSEQEKSEQNSVSGCSSKVWCIITQEPGNTTLSIRAASRSQIINGMLAILVDELSGRDPFFIMAFDASSLSKSGLMELLTPTRINGIQAVLQYIKTVATVYAHSKDRV
jgi:cysteine desulfuration protein SufE